MSIYEKPGGEAIRQTEIHLYGSSRLGITGELTTAPSTVALSGDYGTAKLSTFTRGEKFFELNNHLGNVLVTITDRKLQHNSSGSVDYYMADVATASDYYPSGMLMPGRKWDNGNSYQYGFGGKRKDNEMYGEGNAYDFDARIYDPRLVKWLSVDPLQRKFPSLTPYNYCYNNPIRFFDPDGKLGIEVQVKYNAETNRYTILKIIITDDLEPRPAPYGAFGVDWYNYINVSVYDQDPASGQAKLISGMHEHGAKRTNTLVEAKWWAKAKVNDGVFEDYGCIMWTSKDQTSGSEETRKGRSSHMNNIDGLLAMVNGGNKLGSHEFGKKDLLDVLNKFAELIQEASDSKPADNINMNDSKQADLFKQLGDILEKYTSKSSNSSSNSTTKPKDVILDVRIERKFKMQADGDVRTSSLDPSKPDTLKRIKYYDKPKPKSNERKPVSGAF